MDIWSVVTVDLHEGIVNPVSQYKYDLDLRFRPQHKEHISKAKKVLKLWDTQNSQKYGFIPLSELKLPGSDRKTTITG